MNDQQNMGITHQTVLNFRFFDANAMMALGNDLSLSLAVRELLLLRDHFRMRELRDPTVGELQFLSALCEQRKKKAAHTVITDLAGTDEEKRIFADILRMHTSLGPSPLTLQAMMSAAGRYLARSGILPYHRSLICGATAKMATRAQGQNPALALDLRNISAMLAPAPKPRSPRAQTLILLSPTGNAPFPLEIARFLASHSGLGVSPLAFPHEEGVFAQLLALDQGFVLDLAPFAHQLNCYTPVSALSVGKNAVLLCAPYEVMPRLIAEGAPITVCGVLSGNRTVQIRNGHGVLLSLPLSLLAQLRRQTALSVSPMQSAEQPIDRSITASQDTLLGGICARGGCMRSLLSLIGELIARGADGDRMTLCCALELPSRGDQNAVAAAIPAILELHRVAAELALPCIAPEILQHGDTAPMLTVFACAQRKTAPDEDFLTEWQTAADALDFATLRRLLRCSAQS